MTTQPFALHFGGRDNRLTIPTIAAITRTGTWSVSAWIKIEGDPSSVNMILEYSSSSTNRNALKIQPGASGGVFVFGYYDGSYVKVETNRKGFQDGQWHHVVATQNAGTMKIYVNGEDLTQPGTVSFGALNASAKLLGYQTATSEGGYHLQQDMRIFDRVVTADEAFSIYKDGRSTITDGPTDHIARWDPDRINATTVPDLSGNGYDLTWADYDRRAYVRSYDQTLPTTLQSIYAIGNSLTVDAYPRVMLNRGDFCINTGEAISYHEANPSSSNYDQTYLWGEALYRSNYDVLMIQPFPEDPAQTIAADVSDMATFINLQPDAIILVHEGFAPSSTVETGTAIDSADTGSFAYSRACFLEYVAQLQAAHPGRDIRRTRTNDAVFLIAADLAAGNCPLTEIGGTYSGSALYRDGLHMNLRHGRYLIHNCIRRALGLPPQRGFPFENHVTYGSATAANMDYMDTVIDRVFPDIAIDGKVTTGRAANLDFLDAASSTLSTDSDMTALLATATTLATLSNQTEILARVAGGSVSAVNAITVDGTTVIKRGDDHDTDNTNETYVRIDDSDGSLRTRILAADTVTFGLRQYNARTVALTVSVPDANVIVDPASATKTRVIPPFTATQTAALSLGDYCWDLQLTESEKIATVATGAARVDEDNA